MSLKPDKNGEPEDVLELTIRFSASLPDLHLSISLHTQPNANTSTLKQLIRSHLPTDQASRRIRLIHSGKALADDASLSTSLKRPISHPPTRAATPRPGTTHGSPNTDSPLSTKAKGKLPIRDTLPPTPRIYIHCSIGDVVLSPPELADEVRLGSTTDTAKTSRKTEQYTPQDAPTAPALRGFDRLLTSGFTATEVASLRMQFLAIQAHTHTPDAMPAPEQMRDLEDAWLDNSDPSSGIATVGNIEQVGGEAAGFLSSAEDSEGAGLDDMIYGTTMGFFWPLGCLMWAYREGGVWSARRKMAVVVGMVVNVMLGVVRFSK